MENVRIVIADDNPRMRIAISEFISRIPGCKVIGEAQNGLEALQMIQDLQPDLLLLDIDMPIMDGIEVMNRLVEKHCTIPILFVSGSCNRDMISIVLESGAAGYLVKNDAPAQMADAVNSAITGKRNWRSREAIAACTFYGD